jgi:hypothetical protein
MAVDAEHERRLSVRTSRTAIVLLGIVIPAAILTIVATAVIAAATFASSLFSSESDRVPEAYRTRVERADCRELSDMYWALAYGDGGTRATSEFRLVTERMNRLRCATPKLPPRK